MWTKPERQDARTLNYGRFKRRLAEDNLEDNCWIWKSTCIKRTYSDGVRTRNFPMMPIVVDLANGKRVQKTVYARRWIWEYTFGQLPDPSLKVVNICGNDTCVRPDHRHQRVVENGHWMFADIHAPDTLPTFGADKVARVKRAESLWPAGFKHVCGKCHAEVTSPYCTKCGNVG